MKKVILGLMMLTCIAMLPYSTYAQANSNQQTVDEIIGIVKAQWAAEIADPGNVAEQFKNIAMITPNIMVLTLHSLMVKPYRQD